MESKLRYSSITGSVTFTSLDGNERELSTRELGEEILEYDGTKYLILTTTCENHTCFRNALLKLLYVLKVKDEKAKEIVQFKAMNSCPKFEDLKEHLKQIAKSYDFKIHVISSNGTKKTIGKSSTDGKKELYFHLKKDFHYYALLKLISIKNQKMEHAENFRVKDTIHKEKEKEISSHNTEKLGFEKFNKMMEDWEKGKVEDARLTVMELSRVLQEYSPQSRHDHLIILGGDESSGKTTIAKMLTHQASFPTKDKTTERTLIRVIHDPEEQFVNVVHNDSNQKNNISEIKISTSIKTCGISILDHPGFKKGKQYEATRKLFTDSIRNYAIGKHSVLVLCHAINSNMSDAGWKGLSRELRRFQNHNLVFVVTKMDLLDHNQIARRIINSNCPLIKQARKSNGAYSLSPLDILKFIKWEIGQTANLNPDNFTIFFVASDQMENQKLQEKINIQGAENRWVEVVKYQEKHEKSAFDKLHNAEEWKKFNIILEKMSEEDQLEFNRQFYAKELTAYLWKKQFDGILSLINNCLEELTKKEDQEKNFLSKLNQFSNEKVSLAGLIEKFLKKYNRNCHRIENMQPFESCNEFYQLNLKLKDSFGVTLTEEQAIYESFQNKKSFPPKDRRITIFDKLFQERLNCIQPKSKICSLGALLRRFSQEFALRCLCVDFDEKILEGIENSKNPGTHAKYLAQLEATKLFRDEGNMFTAQRVGLCTLIHANSVLKVMAEIDDYKFLNLDKIEVLSNARKRNLPEEELQNDNIDDYDYEKFISFEEFKKAIKDEKIKTASPIEDICQLILAQYYDSPVKMMKQKLDAQLDAISSVGSQGYIAPFLHFSPLFMHQNVKHVREYTAQNGNKLIVTQLLQKLLSQRITNSASDLNKWRMPEKCGFEQLSDNTKEVLAQLYNLKYLNMSELLDLQLTLLRLNEMPEKLSEFEMFGNITVYEHDRARFVVKRLLSAINIEMEHATFKEIGAYQFRFGCSETTDEAVKEMMERYASLLLGYGYPYKENERPKSKSYLNPNNVIPFLYQFLNEFKNGAEKKILARNLPMAKSPLVQHVFNLCSQQETKEKAQTLVKTLWEKLKNGDLNSEIINALYTSRYKDHDIVAMIKEKSQTAKDYVEQCARTKRNLEIFAEFLKEHGHKIAGLDDIKGLKPFSN